MPSVRLESKGVVHNEHVHAPITDKQYNDWLVAANRQPVVLVDAEHADGVEYFGSWPFISTAYDIYPHRTYEDLLIGNVVIEQRLAQVVVGSLTVINDRSHTDWVDNDWKGHNLIVRLGDARWRLDDFRIVIRGKNTGISAPASNRYRFGVIDRSSILETEIADEDNPITFGTCYNVRPALIDAVALRYKAHSGQLISNAVRDNGLNINPTFDNANGEFELVADPAGQLTCDVATSGDTASEIIADICGLAPVANENARVWDTPDAVLYGLLDDGENLNTNTTHARAVGFLTRSIHQDDGRYYVRCISTHRDSRLLITIDGLAGTNPGAEDYLFLRGRVRHTGNGGPASLRIDTTSSLFNSEDYVEITEIAVDDLVWREFEYIFRLGEYRYIDVSGKENNHDAQYELADLELFKRGIPVNAVNLNAFPNTAQMGLYVDRSTSLKTLFTSVLSSVGGGYQFNTLGELELFRLDLPTKYYDENDAGSMSQETNKVGQNWTVTGGTLRASRESPDGFTFALEFVANAANGRAYINLSDMGCVAGVQYTLTVAAQHNGSNVDSDGDRMSVVVGSTNNANNTIIIDVYDENEEYVETKYTFTYQPTRYLIIKENNTANMGGIRFKVRISPSSQLNILASDIVRDGLTLVGVEEPVKQIFMGYNRNWNVQSADGLAGSVGIQERDDYSTEYQYKTRINDVARYPLARDVRKNTLIKNGDDAQAEADRLQVIRQRKRNLYRVKANLVANAVRLGDTITVTYNDYGFEYGQDVIVIGFKRFLGRGLVELTVWK